MWKRRPAVAEAPPIAWGVPRHVGCQAAREAYSDGCRTALFAARQACCFGVFLPQYHLS